MLSLINDLLDLAKVGAGKIELNMEQLDCREILRDVSTTLQPLVDDKGLSLIVNMPDQALLVDSDRRVLTQIVMNLANNAIKFTARGSVTLEAESNDAGLAIRIIDTGMGIKPENQGRLFSAFTRVEEKAAVREEGTGLGLHLSQRLAGLLDGHITCDSVYGKGSTFTLQLRESE